MNARHALGTLALLAALVVTGCTASPAPASTTSPATASPADETGDGGQSTADACAIVAESVDSAIAAFASASPDDPAAVISALQAASRELVTVSERVTNDDVAALLPPLRDMFGEASEAMKAVADGDLARVADVSRLSGAFQEAASAYQELCATG